MAAAGSCQPSTSNRTSKRWTPPARSKHHPFVETDKMDMLLYQGWQAFWLKRGIRLWPYSKNRGPAERTAFFLEEATGAQGAVGVGGLIKILDQSTKTKPLLKSASSAGHVQ
jgi:hypothetical protein